MLPLPARIFCKVKLLLQEKVNGTFYSGTTGYITGKIAQEGHYATNSKLKIPVSNLTAGNIKKGINIGGVVGTLEPIPSNLSLFAEYFSPANNDSEIVKPYPIHIRIVAVYV